MEKLIESLYRRVFRLEKEVARKEQLIKREHEKKSYLIQVLQRSRAKESPALNGFIDALLKDIDWMDHGMYGCPETCPIQIFGSKKGNNAQHDS